MTQAIIFHTSRPGNRESIASQGLLSRKTTEHNYAGFPDLEDQPVGVYGYPIENSDHGVVWDYEGDVWMVAYCGPMVQDPEVSNALCIQPPEGRVPARFVREIENEYRHESYDAALSMLHEVVVG